MSGSIDKFIQKARTCLQSSRVLKYNHDCQGSISQSYYAMFHAARALLSADGVTFKKHSRVIAAFGERYAKTGKIKVELHRQLSRRSI